MVIARELAGTKPQNPSEVAKEKGFVCGIMGLPRAGKTTLMESLLPDYGPVAVFPLDGGAHVLHDRPGEIQVYTPRDWVHLDQMTDDLCSDPAPFKTIWTDVVTMVQEENIDHYKIHDVPSGDARQRQVRYGDSNWDVLQYHRKLMALAERTGINVIFVYWSSRPVVVEGSGSPLQTRHIVLSPTVSLKVTGILDIILYVEKQPGNEPYPPIITRNGDRTVETASRLSPDNPLQRWPDKFVATPTILTDVINAFHGEINDQYIK